MCRGRSPTPGPHSHEGPITSHTYAFEGKPGPLGYMVLTDAVTKIPGTWYDRTAQANEARQHESDLGLSGVGDADFHKLAKRTKANLMAPPAVDVTVHCESTQEKETISVHSCKGHRTFLFDLAAAKAAAHKHPDGDVFKPFMDKCAEIIAAIERLS